MYSFTPDSPKGNNHPVGMQPTDAVELQRLRLGPQAPSSAPSPLAQQSLQNAKESSSPWDPSSSLITPQHFSLDEAHSRLVQELDSGLAQEKSQSPHALPPAKGTILSLASLLRWLT